MISEIDLREWDFDKLKTSITYLRHGDSASADASFCDDFLREFVEHIETLSRGGTKQIAALFKAK